MYEGERIARALLSLKILSIPTRKSRPQRNFEWKTVLGASTLMIDHIFS